MYKFLRQLFRNKIWNIFYFFLTCTICALFLWYQNILPHKFQLGDRSLHSIVVKQETKIVDTKNTNKIINKVKDKILEYYLQKPPLKRLQTNTESFNTLDSNIKKLSSFFDGNILQFSESKEFESIQNKYKNYNSQTWQSVRQYIKPISYKILSHGYIGTVEINSLKYTLSENFQKKFSEQEVLLLKTILEDSLVQNLSIDLNKLKDFEKERISRIEPIYKTIPAESFIIKKGDLITYDKYHTLQQLNLTSHKKFHFETLLEGLLFTMAGFAVFLLFLRQEKLKLNAKQAVLISSIFILISAWIGLFAFNKAQFIPLPVITLLISVFINISTGIVASIIFTGLILLALKLNPILLLPAIVGVIVSILIVKKSYNRAELIQNGMYLVFAQCLTYLVVTFVSKQFVFAPEVFTHHVITGASSIIFVALCMPFIENILSMVNRFRLRELSDLGRPLLKKLQEQAPGTFEHSIIVADLAVRAAQKLRLDHELIRVGVLYHDIGKLYNPQIFIENQFGGENPHEKMSYEESAIAIIKHIPEGIKMAKKAKLPEPIIDFIPTHQGTALAGHFYLKAKEENSDISEYNFRYQGPKPFNRETGIVMLADTTEAVVRSIKSDNKQTIQNTIWKMIQKKIEDGQLENSGLTQSDLRIVAQAFFECWHNKNHTRIKYKE